MSYISKPEDALDYLKNHIELLKKKTEEVNPSVKKLIEYKHSFDILKYGIEHINNNGVYQSYSSYSKKPEEYADTVEKINERRQKLLEKLDGILPSLEETKQQNLEIIKHNNEVVAKIKLLMQTIGIPSTYSERDWKSRARNPKNITHTAGYLGDIQRNIKTFDSEYSNISTSITNIRNRIDAWANKKIQSIQELEKVKKEEEKSRVKTNLLATLRIKYGCSHEDEEEEIFDVILNKDKYLHLSHYLLMNRNDWSVGPDYADIGLSKFKVETDQDREIYDILWPLIDDWDGDGRVFRDCKWGYGAVFELADPEVYRDYITLTKMFPNLVEM